MALPEPMYQNSAGRLLAILKTFPDNAAPLDVIPNLFEATGKTTEERQQACFAGLMEIQKLYLEFRQDILNAEVNEQQKKVILSGLVSLQQVIYPIQLPIAARAPTDAEKALLEVAATIIPQDAALQKEDIEEIRESIASLRSFVEDAEIVQALRAVLLELIRLSEDAISRFNIYGARGLRRAFKAMLADTIEAYGLALGEGEDDKPKKADVWQAIRQHLRVIDVVASRLLQYKPLLETVSQLMLGGPLP